MMELSLVQADAGTLRAGYSCQCGCTPAVEYGRGVRLVKEGCCCGNYFAVGPDAAASLTLKAGYRAEVQAFDAPWGEHLEAAWLVGPSVHGPDEEHGHEHGHDDVHSRASATQAIDPVCGMTVEPEGARSKGLHSNYQGTDYFFCGKGCKLDFDEDPEHYLDPGYTPSM
jgi:YHS domain-containing protein